MLSSNKAVKVTARSALNGNYVSMFFACAVVLSVYFICNLVASVLSYASDVLISNTFFAVLVFFVLVPVVLGFIRFVWRVLFECVDEPISVFYYFSSKSLYKKVISLSFSILLKIAVIGVFIYLPTIIVWVLSRGFFYDFLDITMPMWAANLNGVLTLLKSISGIMLMLLTIKYYLAPFLIVSDENMDVLEAVHISQLISRKTSVDFIYLILSVIGWILLTLLVAPAVFTLPYLLTVYVVHCRFAVADYNKNVEIMQPKKDFEYFEET